MHYDIVLVGVYAYASRLCEPPVEKFLCGIMSRFCYGYPMDDMVRGVVRPFSVIYYRICRVRTGDECHGGNDIALTAVRHGTFAQNHAMSVFYIPPDDIFRRI